MKNQTNFGIQSQPCIIPMENHVYRDFSSHIEGIEALKEQNPIFAEVCADYQEICLWLDTQADSKDLRPNTYGHAREIRRDLKAEIVKMLRDAGY